MSWVSIDIIFFFPIIILIYFMIPQRKRYLCLLFASYLFCWSWGGEAVITLLLMTLVSYFAGLFLDWLNRNKLGKSKRCTALFLASTIVICLFPMVLYKAADLFEMNKGNSLIMPVGISFYSLQAVGYMVDVYRRRQNAERSLLRYALFLSFFPKLISGPIERAADFLTQIEERTTGSFDYLRVKSGLLLMLWGYFQKLVIADILGLFVDSVYGDWNSYSGTAILTATVAFAVQLYADFAGYSNIAIGAASILGYRMRDNFRQPYFAESIRDFWSRWHISLSSWLRDYIYIPLGGNRRGTWQKNRNVIFTFLISGLWHGSNWTFLCWGLLHAIYQIIGTQWRKVRGKICGKVHINENQIIYKALRRCVVFILVDIAWLFFRAEGIADALSLLRKCVTDIHLKDLVVWQTILYREEWIVVGGAILLLFIVDYFHERGYQIRDWLFRRCFVIRWAVYCILFFVVTVAATRQMGTDASRFLYSQF